MTDWLVWSHWIAAVDIHRAAAMTAQLTLQLGSMAVID
jgi:hypothetical protein